MVFVGIAGMAVGTEALIACIIVMPHGASAPVAAALDAEVVVTFACQCALSGAALQQSLCQGDAGRYLMFLHLLHGKRGIFFDVFHVASIPALRLCGNGTRKERQEDEGKSEIVRSVHNR